MSVPTIGDPLKGPSDRQPEQKLEQKEEGENILQIQFKSCWNKKTRIVETIVVSHLKRTHDRLWQQPSQWIVLIFLLHPLITKLTSL